MNLNKTRNHLVTVLIVATAPSLVGCAGNGTGSAQIFIQAEDTIPDGLEPGTGPENIADGWKVTYDRFLISFGDFRARRSSGSGELLDPRVAVVDLKNLPAGGYVFTRFDEADAVRWDRVGFDLPNATSAAERPDFVTAEDHARMVAGGYSLYFEATLEKADGQACKPTAPADCRPASSIKIAWGVPAGTSFDDCAPVLGDSGFAIPTGGVAQVKPTIHGDHWFFSNITQGAEITVRRAQWVADCDLDGDGTTTIAELQQVKASDLFRAPDYNITGAIGTIETAYDFLVGQARTIGDYQGDGECPTRREL